MTPVDVDRPNAEAADARELPASPDGVADIVPGADLVAAPRRHATAPTLRIGVRQFAHHWPGVVGLAVLAIFVIVALLAPWLAPFDPKDTSGLIKVRPNADHWLGTDHLGRDVLSRLLYGARASLAIGGVTALGTLMVGTVVGAVAGYYGGLIDSVLMRISELFSVVPSFVLALVMVAIWGSSTLLIILALVLALWSQVSRLVRAEVMVITASDMVAAAKASGFRNPRIILSEILPNAMPIIVIQGTLLVGSVVLLEAGLNFLGLGDPQQISWGGMLDQAQGDLRAWWNVIPPGGMIFSVVLSINFLGDAINQFLRPVTAHV